MTRYLPDQRDQWQRALERAKREGIRVRLILPMIDQDLYRYLATASRGGERYHVRVRFFDDRCYVSCTCPAGLHDKICKHAAAALARVQPLDLAETEAVA